MSSSRAQVERIIASVANGSLSPSDATDEVSATFGAHQFPSDGTDTPHVEEFLWTFWNQILDTAEQQPETQERLIAFIKALAVPDRPQSVFRIWGQEMRWQDLALIGAVSRERYNGVEDPSDPESVEKWVALNAFLARLTAEKGLFMLYAIWTFRDAFEGPPSESTQLQSVNVRAAAAWIRFAGQRIHDSDEEFESGPTLGDPAAGGQKWTGKSGFDPARWALWEEEFSQWAEDSSIDSTARSDAAEAVQIMKQIGEK
ncbi:hypothetical protein HGRIS_010458 [Hohenbuehelia grisea]|uniref:Uncharacterized protein n=1 Tax=Hohenbuehelia grisea TaxID=104357 RepID=A0ABR3IZD0_9AGAR